MPLDTEMRKLLFLILAVSIQSMAHAAESFSTLEERMSGKEFGETGLVKLSEKELAALNDWLRSHSVATLENATARPASAGAQTASSEDLRGFDNQPKDDPDGKEIHGTIAGTFDGWNGKGTLFKLTNGMVWEQTEKDKFSIEPVENAQVTIQKKFMRNWHLSVDGYKEKVQVERLK